jgi:septal ring factor EnvC (AmiA/AmiB activator)
MKVSLQIRRRKVARKLAQVNREIEAAEKEIKQIEAQLAKVKVAA